MTARALSPADPAVLFRSRAEWPDEIERAVREQIGDGALAKMVRIAMSDPDDELWRYSIAVAGEVIAGKAISRLTQL